MDDDSDRPADLERVDGAREMTVPGTPLVVRAGGGAAVLVEGWDRDIDLGDDDDGPVAAAFDAVEAVVLGHAAAGIDVGAHGYGEGIVSAVEAITNNV